LTHLHALIEQHQPLDSTVLLLFKHQSHQLDQSILQAKNDSGHLSEGKTTEPYNPPQKLHLQPVINCQVLDDAHQTEQQAQHLT
jgi:hypothetical protein